jgi:hypothetical protein
VTSQIVFSVARGIVDRSVPGFHNNLGCPCTGLCNGSGDLSKAYSDDLSWMSVLVDDDNHDNHDNIA